MIVLASASERRAFLLRMLGVDFIQCKPEVEESFGEDAKECALKNAFNKARFCAGIYPEHLVLGFDTVVVVDGQILGKPEKAKQAREFLLRLSGKQHEVITGIAGVWKERNLEFSAFEQTKVFFRHIKEEEIEWYLKSQEWKGKAGGYGIQGKASVFVERIEGCYFNVVGLPIAKTIALLAEHGIKILG